MLFSILTVASLGGFNGFMFGMVVFSTSYLLLKQFQALNNQVEQLNRKHSKLRKKYRKLNRELEKSYRFDNEFINQWSNHRDNVNVVYRSRKLLNSSEVFITEDEIVDNEIIDNEIIDNEIIDNEIIDNEIVDSERHMRAINLLDNSHLQGNVSTIQSNDNYESPKHKKTVENRSTDQCRCYPPLVADLNDLRSLDEIHMEVNSMIRRRRELLRTLTPLKKVQLPQDWFAHYPANWPSKKDKSVGELWKLHMNLLRHNNICYHYDETKKRRRREKKIQKAKRRDNPNNKRSALGIKWLFGLK